MIIQVSNRLLIPFGCPKWDISKIKIAGVSTDATYFESETPCAYIDKTSKRALRLCDIRSVFPERLPYGINDVEGALTFIRDYIKKRCEIQTASEGRFLDLYFEVIQSFHYSYLSKKELDPWVFGSLLPLPQAHFYLYDPLKERDPSIMVKLDFAFWTGERFVAVEIDGPIHEKSDSKKKSHIRRDRILENSGIKVCHILNDEILQYGLKAMKLLPDDVLPYSMEELKKRVYIENPLKSFSFNKIKS